MQADLYSILFYIAFVVYVSVGAYVIGLNAKSNLNRVFSLTCSALGLWAVSLAFANNATHYDTALFWRRLASLGWGSAFSFQLHYFLILTEAHLLKKKMVYFILYIPPLIFVTVFGLYTPLANGLYGLVLNQSGWVNHSTGGCWDVLYNIYYVTFTLLGLTVLWMWSRKSSDKLKKQTAAIVSITFLIAVFFGTITDMIINYYKLAEIPQLGIVFTVMPVLGILYSVKKHGIMATSEIANEGNHKVLGNEYRKKLNNYLYLIISIGSLVNLGHYFYYSVKIESVLSMSLSIFLVGIVVKFISVLKVKHFTQDMLLFICLSVLNIMIQSGFLHEYGDNIVWPIPIIFLLVTVLFENQIFFVYMVLVTLGFQLWSWKSLVNLEVEVNQLDYMSHAVLYVLISLVVYYINRVYMARILGFEKLNSHQELLSSISTNLISASPDNLGEKIGQTIRSIGEHFSVDSVSYYEYSKDLDQVWLSSAWRRESMPAAQASNEPIKASSLVWLVNEYAQNGKVCISDVSELPREACFELEELGIKDSRSILSMPIRQNDRLLGTITLQSMVKKAEWAKDDQMLFLLVTGSLADTIVKVESEKKISYMAYYDALTGLVNRAYFGLQLDKMIEIARRKNKLIGVLFFDLDEFKAINDTMGHDSGDQLLKEISSRLSQTTRKTDSVCRFGGDEFLIMLPMMEDMEEIRSTAEKAMKAFKAPVRIQGQEFFVTASCGIAVYPTDATSSEILIKSADMAMYEAKGNGKNTYAFCTPVMKEAVQEKMKLTNDLYRAIEQKEFVLHYQPQVHIESGRIIGLEALIRWQHPERGLISPGIFIPLAEQTGLIHRIGEWVLKTACVQNKSWQMKGFSPVVMAVNLSVEQFRGNRLIEVIEKALKESRLDPKFLELEITESVVIKEPSYIIKMLQDMKALGVSISIDDFGTEYSSLSRLKELPIDRLKLAMEFVKGIDMGEKDEAIAMVIINLAKSLGMRVIAEGVEKETQLNFLKSRVCDEVQGFYFYHPMPADEVEKIMKSKL